MTGVCRECREGLEHCHGAIVHHASFAVECTEDCATPEALHALHLDCDAVGCTCAEILTAWAVS
ncbi:hypothetical protein TUM20985_02970 [Mycobacterium antarcticum]|uniref:hypothetical protein n=1 Tax=unclassified Mycolicibacterium TaxID=2636767 RepID=UPI0023A5CDD5|nr:MULTISPECIES: hypothetical protein [unclassified Mycolicibacterium]BDX29750.1 hypothetical protein TUM20985_02970 [Mycolicibacterium sp. TUM20985]GLP73178.1 hypothetical protein TUM20983_02880 [Mycolicibacterium sp. TUM20983]GLP78891.1 hypothetical protein TUM20984_03110 [Mycolicibacterium sp. TUM20984]